MSTDQDLTTELGEAFRAETRHLSYAGRRRPRPTPVAALPALGLVAAVGVTGVLALGSPDASAPQRGPTAAPAAVPATAPASKPASEPAARTVTATIRLAGFTLRYDRRVGEPDPLHSLSRPGPVPEGFTVVPMPGTDVEAWVGRRPGTDESALYVLAPTRNGGRLFALVSSAWTQDQLVDLLKHGSPRPVPMIDG